MQGFNMGRYVPPDQEGVVSGNRLLGNRAQKATRDGVPLVRFEMPFAVWCDGCEARAVGRDGKTHPVLIGQGVRFNAEKHRTGNYYSTPIWTFRMRHTACGTWLAIRTDPATTSYVVAEGGRRRREYKDDDGDDDSHDGAASEGRPLRPEEAAARSAAAQTGAGGDVAAADGPRELDRLDAFDRLERTIHHRAPAAADAGGGPDGTAALSGRDAARRLAALAQSNARQWEDPYARNRALRAAFRVGRHARERAAQDDAGLRARLGGLSETLPLLPATDADARHAALVDFGSRPAGSETPRALADRRTLAQPLLLLGTRAGGAREAARVRSAPAAPDPPRHRTYAASTEAARRQRSIRDHLASTVLANTRLTTDPFVAALVAAGAGGSPPPAGRPKPAIKGLKRSATTAESSQRTETGTQNAGSHGPRPEAKAKRQRGMDGKEEGGGATPEGDRSAAAALVSYDSE